MSGIAKVSKKGVEVGVEVGELANRVEGSVDAITPPSTLEAAQLVIEKSSAEGQPRRGTESAAKAGGDGVFGRVEAELPRKAGVGASYRLAGLEQSAGS